MDTMDTPKKTAPELSLPRELDLDTAMQIAIKMHQADDLESARKIYTRVLKVVPEHPAALNFLGVLEHQSDHSELGLTLINRAIEAAPDYIDAINNLGTIYRSIDRYEEAQECYQRCLTLDDEFASAYWNLGEMLRHTHGYEQAVDYYRKAILKWPNKPEILHLLGVCLRYSSRAAEAADVYTEILKLKPDDSEARHLLAACSGNGVPARGSDEYVQKHFDSFSGNFDKVLGGLDYRAPDLVVRSLAAAYGDPDGGLHVLDVGCGTGLCGPGLRPFAATLEGVDLSSGMLEQARTRGCYDDLHEGELEKWLRAQTAAYDVVTSADTLCYFGILDATFQAAAQALRPGGWLIFTVEASVDKDAHDWRIYPHGRYSHSESYLTRSLRAAGFGASKIAREPLRKESGQPVAGWVVTARCAT